MLRRKLVLLFLAALPIWAADVPRKAPELAIAQPGNKQVLLSQYRGKVVVVAFILTT